MRAAVFHGRGDVRVENVPDPVGAGPDDVVVRVQAASLCGTDVSEYTDGPIMVPLHVRHNASGHRGPTILGHEFTGEIVDIGSHVDRNLLGRRVVPGAASWCSQCLWCNLGRINLCADYFIHGIHAHGGMAEYAVVPAAMCHVVPDICAPTAAATAQPLAVALHAIERSNLNSGDTVVIVGVGGIGAYLVAAAQTCAPGLTVAIDLNPARIARARSLGAHVGLLRHGDGNLVDVVRDYTHGHGADVVIEATGTSDGLETALHLTRHGGRLQLVGLQRKASTIDMHHIVLHEIDLSTSNGQVTNRNLPAAIDLLATTDLATRVSALPIPLSAVVTEGLAVMADDQALGKVVVDMHRDTTDAATHTSGHQIHPPAAQQGTP